MKQHLKKVPSHFFSFSQPRSFFFKRSPIFYPRTVKYVATSREAHEDDEGTLDEIKTNVVAGTFAAVILSPALLVTVPTLLPALVVTAGRKAKHGIQDFREWMNESDDEEPKEKKEENKEEET